MTIEDSPLGLLVFGGVDTDHHRIVRMVLANYRLPQNIDYGRVEMVSERRSEETVNDALHTVCLKVIIQECKERM